MKLVHSAVTFSTARRGLGGAATYQRTVPITVLLYDGPLLCGFNVPIKAKSVYIFFLWRKQQWFFIAATTINEVIIPRELRSVHSHLMLLRGSICVMRTVPFLPHDAMHKRGYSRHAVSVCLSVTFVDYVKTNKYIFKFFSLSGSHIILVFPYQTGWRYSHGNLPNGGVECRCGIGRNRDSGLIAGYRRLLDERSVKKHLSTTKLSI